MRANCVLFAHMKCSTCTILHDVKGQNLYGSTFCQVTAAKRHVRFENIVRNDLPLLVEKDYGSGLVGTMRALLPFWAMAQITLFYGLAACPGYSMAETLLMFPANVVSIFAGAATAVGLHFAASMVAASAVVQSCCP